MKRRPPADNVRNIRPQGKNLRFKTFSSTGRLVQVEFWRERKFLYKLTFGHHTVADIISQPEWFEYFTHDGELRKHVPDYKVIRIDGSIEIHDVIRQQYAETAASRERERAMHRMCQARGWTYQVHIEEYLASDTEIANIQALSAYKAGVHHHPDVEAAIRSTLSRDVRLDLEVLAHRLARELSLPASQVMAALGHMLCHGRLVTDMDTRLLYLDASIRPGTLVWLPSPD